MVRLWHKYLIHVLPRQQLLGQWRECCAIARNIAEKGTPGHILVNRIVNYPMGHFWEYGYLICGEMRNRGYKCDFGRFEQWFNKPWALLVPNNAEMFEGWHNNRYLSQCFYNLQEKYDCGGISEKEWDIILKEFPWDIILKEFPAVCL